VRHKNLQRAEARLIGNAYFFIKKDLNGVKFVATSLPGRLRLLDR